MDLGLPLRPGCDETHQLPLRLIVKEEDIKEEEYGHIMTWQDGEENPIADLQCKTESDFSESSSSTHNDTLQTLEVKVKKDEDEQECNDCPLESASDGTQLKLHGQNDEELNQQLDGGPYHCTVCRESFTVLRELEEHQQTHTLSANNQRLNPGSTFKKCISCHTRIWVSCKRCKACGAEQPKKAQNVPKVLDKASALVFQMQQVGLCPLLLFCHIEGTGCKVDFSTSIVPETAKEKKALDHIKTLFEALVKSVAARQTNRNQTGASDVVADRNTNENQTGAEHSDGTQQKLHGQNDELNQQLNGGPYHCTVCRESFTVLRELEEHQQTHTLSANQKQNTGEKLHKCAQCGKAFTCSSDLQRHILIHAGKKLHVCTECGKAFSHISGLKIHMRIHTGEKPHKCVQCGKAFSRIENLKKHRLIHTGEKPHKCAQCGKSFSSFTYLQTHMLIHAGVKPHKCAQCGKAFTNTSQLNAHMRLHTGEKPYKCAQCGKAFTSSSQLDFHMPIHTREKSFKCDQCEKAYSHFSHLKTHMLIHTGEKPHKCAQCGKAFSRFSYLKTHMLTHTGEKPHTCAQCGKSFTQVSNLKMHMLIHTSRPQCKPEKVF